MLINLYFQQKQDDLKQRKIVLIFDQLITVNLQLVLNGIKCYQAMQGVKLCIGSSFFLSTLHKTKRIWSKKAADPDYAMILSVVYGFLKSRYDSSVQSSFDPSVNLK